LKVLCTAQMERRGEELTRPEKRNGFKGQVDNVFRKGYGSVLFFEDQAVLDDFSGKFPGYSSVRPQPFPVPLILYLQADEAVVQRCMVRQHGRYLAVHCVDRARGGRLRCFSSGTSLSPCSLLLLHSLPTAP
jgi:hypothetical protein